MKELPCDASLVLLNEIVSFLENWEAPNGWTYDESLLWARKFTECLLRGNRSGPGTTALQIRLMRLGTRTSAMREESK